jgi:hypothetical protein
VLGTDQDANSDALFLVASTGQKCADALDHMIRSEASMQLSKARLIPQMWAASFDPQARSEPGHPRPRVAEYHRRTKSDGGQHQDTRNLFPTVSVDEWILECLRKNSHHKLYFMSVLQSELGCLTQLQPEFDRWEDRIVQSWTIDPKGNGMQGSTKLSWVSPTTKSPADNKELYDSSEPELFDNSPHSIAEAAFTIDLDCDPASAVVHQRQLQALALHNGIPSYMEGAISSPADLESRITRGPSSSTMRSISFPDLVVTAPERGNNSPSEVTQSTDQLRVAEDCLARFDSAHNSDIGDTQRTGSGIEGRPDRTVLEAAPMSAVNWGRPTSNSGWSTEIEEAAQCFTVVTQNRA